MQKNRGNCSQSTDSDSRWASTFVSSVTLLGGLQKFTVPFFDESILLLSLYVYKSVDNNLVPRLSLLCLPCCWGEGRDLHVNGYSKIRFPIDDWNWINYFSVDHVLTSYELCSFFPGEMQMPYLGWKRQSINRLRLVSFGIFGDEIVSSSPQTETWFWSIHSSHDLEERVSFAPGGGKKKRPRERGWVDSKLLFSRKCPVIGEHGERDRFSWHNQLPQ